jgi:predicted transcriptional regulator
MIKNDAMTNQEISMAANMKESAISKYLRELYTSGVIIKASVYGEKSVYYINNRYRQIILDIFKNFYTGPTERPFMYQEIK